MADEIIEKPEENELAREVEKLDLIAVMDAQVYYLKALKKIEFTDLYDKYPEHKIAAVTDCFRVMREAQRALSKLIKAD
jgi:hypothetical protein